MLFTTYFIIAIRQIFGSKSNYG